MRTRNLFMSITYSNQSMSIIRKVIVGPVVGQKIEYL